MQSVRAVYAIGVPHRAALTIVGESEWRHRGRLSYLTIVEWMAMLDEHEWALYVNVPPNDHDERVAPGSVLFGWVEPENGTMAEVFKSEFLYVVKVDELHRFPPSDGPDWRRRVMAAMSPPEPEEWATAARTLVGLCPKLPDPPDAYSFVHIETRPNK